MALPDSIMAMGEQIEAGGEIAPASDLFEAYDVFSAELNPSRRSDGPSDDGRLHARSEMNAVQPERLQVPDERIVAREVFARDAEGGGPRGHHVGIFEPHEVCVGGWLHAIGFHACLEALRGPSSYL